MKATLDKIWYEKHFLRWFLWPFSLIYRLIFCLRSSWLKTFRQEHFSIPIIIVGNLSVGGVGKTPFVIALAKAFKAQGVRVGIVSRGYKSMVKNFPYLVEVDADAALVGDEPLLIAKKTLCPTVIAPKRVAAVKFLIDRGCQLIISDDGLQHYALGRQIEIALIDGQRGFGNGLCLPAGPLRESEKRLRKVDFILATAGPWSKLASLFPPLQIKPCKFRKLSTDKEAILPVEGLQIAAVAGIGNPQKFFTTLQNLGLIFKPYSFPDHYRFSLKDFEYLEEKTLVMTEKDAVKCQAFAKDSWYYLPIEIELAKEFWRALCSHEQLKGLM